MREYKFRGKCVERNRWVYGCYVKGIQEDKAYILNKHDGYWPWGDIWSVVYPETVGQYIERKDKNKEEIYEGDIVLYDRNIHEDIDKQKFEVIWMQDGYCLRELKHKYILDDIWWELTKKIGNIYDNPELMKEGSV